MRRLLWFLAASLAAFAAENPVAWSLGDGGAGKPLKPGATFEARLLAKIEPGWHLYSTSQPPGGPIPTRIWLPAGQPFALGGATGAPRPKVAFDQNFEMDVESYNDTAAFTLPVKVSAGAAAGAQKLAVQASFQACNDRMCLPPRTVKLEMPVEIAAGAGK